MPNRRIYSLIFQRKLVKFKQELHAQRVLEAELRRQAMMERHRLWAKTRRIRDRDDWVSSDGLYGNGRNFPNFADEVASVMRFL